MSSRGFWLFFAPLERELYLPFSSFPWFEHATIRQLSTIEVERDRIVRWPELDVDLDIDRIERPDRYPLVARVPGRRSRRSAPTPSRQRRTGRGVPSGTR